jgi:DNA repair protein SbcD/Mre11
VSTIRIAHLSDTHLGYRALSKTDPISGRNQRAVDIEQALERTVTDILRRDVDLVVHSGDVFHHPRPAYIAMRIFVRQFRRLEQAGIPIIVIGGNHDTPRLQTSSSVFSILELALPDVHFVTGYEQEVLPFKDLNLLVHAVPHGKLTQPIEPSVFPRAGVRNILVTHGFPHDHHVSRRHHEPGEEEIPNELFHDDLDYIALGHYHLVSQPRDNAWFAGSTERMGWGDEEAKPGYVIVELAEPGQPPSVAHHPIPTRPMRTLPDINSEGMTGRSLADAILYKVAGGGFEESLVRITVNQAERAVRREAESLLRKESQGIVWWIQINQRTDPLAAFARGQGERTVTDLLSMFAHFVDEEIEQQQMTREFGERFRLRGRAALEEAIQRAEDARGDEEGAA